MRDEAQGLSDEDEGARPGESFLQRLHRRKHEARLRDSDAARAESTALPATVEPPAAEPTDADMPPLESLTSDSDYSGFLSTKVSESLRRAALRKLFHSAELNVIDELDDYAEDFTTFTALGDVITADMRHRIEVEARRQAEALKRAVLEDHEDTPEAPQTETDAKVPTVARAEPAGEAERPVDDREQT